MSRLKIAKQSLPGGGGVESKAWLGKDLLDDSESKMLKGGRRVVLLLLVPWTGASDDGWQGGKDAPLPLDRRSLRLGAAVRKPAQKLGLGLDCGVP